LNGSLGSLQWAVCCLAFLTTVLYVPGLMSPSEVPRLALLSVVLPTLLAYLRPPWRGLWPLAALLAWALLSLAWTPDWRDGLLQSWMLTLIGLSALLGSALPSLQPVWLAFGAGLVANAAAMAAQDLGWEGLLQTAPPGGLFLNRNMAGEIAAVTLVGLLLYRHWLLALAAAAVLALSLCRGAMIGSFASLVLWLWPRSRWMAATLGLGALNVGVLLWTQGLLGPSVAQRLAMWRDTAANLGFFGAGIGATYSQYPLYNTLTDAVGSRPLHIHNSLLEWTYELGLPGLVAILWTVARARNSDERTALPLLAAAVCGLSGLALHQPATVLAFGLCLGYALGGRNDLRGAFYGR